MKVKSESEVAQSCPTLHDPMDGSLPGSSAHGISQARVPEWGAIAAKSLQSCPTLCDPIDGSPPGSPVPEILQARTLEWVAISFSKAWKWKVKGKSLCCVWLLATLWTAAYQAPPPMGFSRQEYWSGVPLPSPNTHLQLPFSGYMLQSLLGQEIIMYLIPILIGSHFLYERLASPLPDTELQYVF